MALTQRFHQESDQSQLSPSSVITSKDLDPEERLEAVPQDGLDTGMDTGGQCQGEWVTGRAVAFRETGGEWAESSPPFPPRSESTTEPM